MRSCADGYASTADLNTSQWTTRQQTARAVIHNLHTQLNPWPLAEGTSNGKCQLSQLKFYPLSSPLIVLASHQNLQISIDIHQSLTYPLLIKVNKSTITKITQKFNKFHRFLANFFLLAINRLI